MQDKLKIFLSAPRLLDRVAAIHTVRGLHGRELPRLLQEEIGCVENRERKYEWVHMYYK